MNELATTTGQMLVVPAVNMASQFALAQTRLQDLTAFAITTQSDADIVSTELAKSKELAKELDAARTETKAPFFETGKAIDAAYKPTLDTLAKIKEVCEGALKHWGRAQAEIARQEQARLDLAAAAEREKLRKQAEQQAAIAKAAEEAAKAATNQEQAQAAAEQAQAAREAQQALNNQALTTVSAPSVALKTKGTTIVDNWQAKVLDDGSVALKYIISQPHLHYLLLIDSSALLKAAKQQKDALKIDGIRIWNDGSVRSNLAKAA